MSTLCLDVSCYAFFFQVIGALRHKAKKLDRVLSVTCTFCLYELIKGFSKQEIHEINFQRKNLVFRLAGHVREQALRETGHKGDDEVVWRGRDEDVSMNSESTMQGNIDSKMEIFTNNV